MGLVTFIRNITTLNPSNISSTLRLWLDNLSNNLIAINSAAVSSANISKNARPDIVRNDTFNTWAIELNSDDSGKRQYHLYITTSGQNLAISFPASSSLSAGDRLMLYFESKDASYTATAALDGSQTVDGSASDITFTNEGDYIILEYTGSDLFYKVGGTL